jgi:hypothetical protein
MLQEPAAQEAEPSGHLVLTFPDRSGTGPVSGEIRRYGTRVDEVAGGELARLLAALAPGEAGPVWFQTRSGRRMGVQAAGFDGVANALRNTRRAARADDRLASPVTPLPTVPVPDPPVPPAIEAAAATCPQGAIDAPPQAWRGLGGQMLWRIPCDNPGINRISLWYISGPQGAPPVPALANDPILFNAGFEGATGRLAATVYFGAWHADNPEDCGVHRVYGWGLRGLELIEERMLPVCGTGLEPPDWIETYRAPEFGSGVRAN